MNRILDFVEAFYLIVNKAEEYRVKRREKQEN